MQIRIPNRTYVLGTQDIACPEGFTKQSNFSYGVVLDADKSTNSTVKECGQKCLRNTRCHKFVHNINSQTCTLLDAGSTHYMRRDDIVVCSIIGNVNKFISQLAPRLYTFLSLYFPLYSLVPYIKLEHKSCSPYYDKYGTAAQAQAVCTSDDKCVAIYDEKCDNNGTMKLCSKTSAIFRDSASCIYVAEGMRRTFTSWVKKQLKFIL